MKKLSSTAYAVIAIISIILIVAFTYLWATMTGTVSNVLAGVQWWHPPWLSSLA